LDNALAGKVARQQSVIHYADLRTIVQEIPDVT
jgi:hypothetical protein